MMKRKFLICLALVAVLMLAMSVAAFATEESTLPELASGVNTNADGTETTFTWTFNEGVLNINTLSNSDLILNANHCTFLDWKNAYREKVTKIYVSNAIIYQQVQISGVSEGVFDNYPNLEAILLAPRVSRFQTSFGGFFAGNPNLTTVDWGTSWDNVEYGVIDLSGIQQCHQNPAENMFNGCSSIKKVILPHLSTWTPNCASTNIYAKTFSGCTALEEVVLPSTVTSVDANAFADCPNVVLALQDGALYDTLAGYGMNVVIDLRETALADYTFERSESTEALTVYLAEGDDAVYSAESLSAKFGTNVTYYVYPTSSGADAVRELLKTDSTASMVYYPSLARSGTESVKATFTWSIDEATGYVTINTSYGYGELYIGEGSEYLAWKQIWRDAIVRIQVAGEPKYGKIQFTGASEGIFDNMPNIEAVLLHTTADRFAIYTGGVFRNCPKLTTVDFGASWDTVEWGVIDITELTEISDTCIKEMFSGCTSIKTVKLGAFPTKLLDSTFAGCSSLEYIHIPSTITAVEATSFTGCDNLLISTDTAETYKTLKGYGLNVVIDARTASLADIDLETYGEAAGNEMTVFLPSGTSEELTADALSAKFGANVTYYVYPTSSGATAVRSMTSDTVKMVYYPVVIDSTLARDGAETVVSKYEWTFDEITGTLTVNTRYSAETGGEFYMINSSVALYNWKAIWADAIVRIQIAGNPLWSKMQFGSQMNLFDNLPNLEAVLFTPNCNGWALTLSTGLFENCKSLTTIAWDTSWANVEWGVIDLSSIEKLYNTNSLVNMFKGCTSIEEVRINSAVITAIEAGMFTGCTSLQNVTVSSYVTSIAENAFSDCSSLESITIPASVTAVGTSAFSGCENLKSVQLENPELLISDATVFPDKAGFYVLCHSDESANAITEAYEKTVGVTLNNIVSAEGFQIRFTGKNGLRGIFRADEVKIDDLTAKGFTVAEYGTIVGSADEYNSREGFMLGKVNGEYVTNGDKIIKIEVWKDNGFVGKILSTSTEAATDYAIAVVNYTANYKSDIYMCAYIIITDPYGNDYILYENYGKKNADFEFTSIYDVTIAMFKDETSPIHTNTLEEATVWNTVMQGAIEIGGAYENEVAENVTFALVEDGDGYVGMLRSLTGADAITAEAAEAAAALIPDGYTASEMINTVISGKITASAPVEDAKFAYPSVAPLYPTYNREEDQAQHVQGFCTDGEYMYYSLTGFIIKTDMEGNEIGRVHAYNNENSNPGLHIGAITYHDGYIYAPINYMWWGNNYIGVIDTDAFVDSDPETDGIQAVGREAINILYTPELHDAKFRVTLEDGSTRQLYRTTGIDGAAVGKLPGGGYIDPVSGEEVEDDNYYVIVSHGIALDNDNIYYDDDYKMFSAYDISDIESKLINIDEISTKGEGMEQTAKYVFRAYTGASQYGVQNLEYDSDTGDYWLWCYGRPLATDFPTMNFFVIDGSKKLKMETIEVGQSVSENSPAYAEASATAALYVDENGNYPMGYVAELKCICGKGDIENHAAACYGETGYASRICGVESPVGGSQGFCYLGDDYFFAGNSNNSKDENGYTIYGTNANLYRVSRKLGEWKFVRIGE